jgi:hypothetical protein
MPFDCVVKVITEMGRRHAWRMNKVGSSRIEKVYKRKENGRGNFAGHHATRIDEPGVESDRNSYWILLTVYKKVDLLQRRHRHSKPQQEIFHPSNFSRSRLFSNLSDWPWFHPQHRGYKRRDRKNGWDSIKANEMRERVNDYVRRADRGGGSRGG